MNILDALSGQAGATAADSALATASARPFNVILSLDDQTRQWATALALGVVAVVVFLKRKG